MDNKKQTNPIDAIKKLVELGMPDLRHYYRMPKKAKVVAVYASEGGKYYADVQPLRNDETIDESEPVVQKVEIPVLWGGPNRGLVCPPTEGVHCDLMFYDGDPNYPRISNFRWFGMDAPAAELNEFVIQLEPGVEIRIDKNKQIVTLTPENIISKAGKSWTINAGDNATIVAGKEATLEAGTVANIAAPLINLCGRIVGKAYKGKGRAYAEFEGDVVILGSEEVKENHKIGGNLHTIGNSSTNGSSVVSGNSYSGSRSGGTCPHKC